jgi:phage terminase large subunit-like protein
VKHRGVRSSQLKGVSWEKGRGKWQARCERRHLGYHATEEAAARAYDTYVKDGNSGPVLHRAATSSQFKGVSWEKRKRKWEARQGLTLVHFSAELERCLTHEKPLKNPLTPPEHWLHDPYAPPIP